MSHLELVALVVSDYDAAIDFFVRILSFELVENVPSLTNDGRPKRWAVVRPPGAVTGILLAPERMVNSRRRSRAVSSPGASASSCESRTSTRPIGE